MPRGRELTPQMRSRICELRSVNKWGAKRIHRVHPEISLSTIHYTLRNEANRQDNISKPRSGARRKLSDEDRDHIYELIMGNPHIKCRELLEEVENRVQRSTLWRLFNEMGIRKWRQLCRPALNESRAARRLAWALAYQHYTPGDWARVCWTDECTIERGHGIEPIWTFTRPSEQIRDHDIRPIELGKRVKQMFWAGFGEEFRTVLIPLDGDPEAPRNGVTARVIYELYCEMLPLIMEEADVFMHDNAPVHKARQVRELLAALGIETMEWPPYSPDLNPIENLWSILKREIYQLYPDLEHASDSIETKERLIKAAKEAWASIRPDILVRLSETMPNRVEAIINANGWYTEY